MEGVAYATPTAVSGGSEPPVAERRDARLALRPLGALNQPNRRGTDPYARWCGRRGAVRLPPIPINELAFGS